MHGFLIQMIMKQVEERYISLLTDFGFKRIFGTAKNKDLLICFLNNIFFCAVKGNLSNTSIYFKT